MPLLKHTKLTDRTTTVSTAVTYQRLHFDLTRFYLVENGTDALLYITDPVNGTQVIGLVLTFRCQMSAGYIMAWRLTVPATTCRAITLISKGGLNL